MGRIKCLSPHVADMIAAGEVVERPGSAVKELVENSIDAGATVITVEIQRGGMSYIRVTDNGCGMSAEDAQTAFLRHATSKLADEYGLEAINTLGFRGEALAAISAVSVVELLTREKGAPEGTAVTLEAGEIVEAEPAGCPEGTTIIVRSLFYNTPARLKFMKKDSAEAANVSSAVIRCAMSHPDVSIRFIKDGSEEFKTPGDGNVESCVYSLQGRDFAKNLLAVTGTGEGTAVRGFVTPPANARGNRGAQFFFVNGRFVKSALLQSALEQAYRNSLFTGRFPGCVIYLEVKYNEVDVNVHPAKTEIKFLNERKVFDTVYIAVKAALAGENRPPEISLEGEKKPVEKAETQPVKNPLQEEKPQQEKKQPMLSRTEPAVRAERRPQSVDDEEFERLYNPVKPAENMNSRVTLRQEGMKYDSPGPEKTIITRHVVIEEPVAPPHETLKRVEEHTAETAFEEKKEKPADEKSGEAAEIHTPSTEIPEEKPQAQEQTLLTREEKPSPRYSIIGEAFNEFIIVECNSELIFIDKHAAHERMLFDRLKSRKYDAMSQLLLVPAIAELGREEKQLILDNAEMLDEMGFEIEDFGGASLAVRRLPADVDMEDTQALLEELCRDIKYGGRPGNLGVRDELLATVACKAAIKAGRGSDPMEWKPVVEAVISGEVKYCPHGRPVTMRLTKSQLDKNFKRT